MTTLTGSWTDHQRRDALCDAINSTSVPRGTLVANPQFLRELAMTLPEILSTHKPVDPWKIVEIAKALGEAAETIDRLHKMIAGRRVNA